MVSFGLRVATGAAVLDHTYHFDERYSFRNVSALLVEGTSRPANEERLDLRWTPRVTLYRWRAPGTGEAPGGAGGG